MTFPAYIALPNKALSCLIVLVCLPRVSTLWLSCPRKKSLYLCHPSTQLNVSRWLCSLKRCASPTMTGPFQKDRFFVFILFFSTDFQSLLFFSKPPHWTLITTERMYPQTKDCNNLFLPDRCGPGYLTAADPEWHFKCIHASASLCGCTSQTIHPRAYNRQ